MQLTAEMILTDFGTVLPLDRRRKDALATYARKAAWAAGARSAQRWVESTWGLKDYEAKDLLKGNASEMVWERIVKHNNGGWAVVIPVMGSVIGQGLEDWMRARLAAEKGRLARERERYEAEHARADQVARDLSALLGVAPGSRREPSPQVDRSEIQRDSRLGREHDGTADVAEPKTFALRRRD